MQSPRPVPVARGAERPGRLPGRFWLSWGVVTAGIAVEFCLVLWTADVLREIGVKPGQAAARVTALIGGMALGRFAGSRLALRWPVDTLLYGAIVTTTVGFLGLWLADAGYVGIPALLVCGLGVALFYPLGIARVIEHSEGRPDQASARAGLGAALASGVAPFVLGAIADAVGIHLALLVVPVLLAIAAAGVRLGRTPALGPPAATATAETIGVPTTTWCRAPGRTW